MTDKLINQLRVLINHLLFMKDKDQYIAIDKANKILDRYFLDGGKFIKTDVIKFIKGYRI